MTERLPGSPKGKVPFVAAVLSLLLALAVTPALLAGGCGATIAGIPGLGDPYFPLAGNGGYDVSHYTLQLAVDPSDGSLAGTASVTATATQDLDRFDLDLDGLEVRTVTIESHAAHFSRSSPTANHMPVASSLRADVHGFGRLFRNTPRICGPRRSQDRVAGERRHRVRDRRAERRDDLVPL